MKMNMSLTRENFMEGIKGISSGCEEIVNVLMLSKCSLPEIAKHLAIHIFTEKVSECEGTQILRLYLTILNTDGYVSFME
jgi:hypothetical protein